MTRDQERGLVFLIALALLAGGVVLLWPKPRPASSGWVRPIVIHGASVVVPVFIEAKRIDVNVASAAELTELPGIGPVLAERIVAYRAAHGAFRTLDSLAAVKGVGPAIVDGLREQATVGAEGGPREQGAADAGDGSREQETLDAGD
jgi:competence ComEA-like helix-hairpin-helix protein